jgi:3',5'-cyclic AMP phosphodiesterase CpdA
MNELTFALISDLHFGPEAKFAGKLRKLTAHAPLLSREFARRMNDVVRPDFIVNLGDDLEDESYAADRSRYAECLGILREARADLVNVAGNHDTVYLKKEDLLAAWGKPADAELYSSFDRDGYHFIVLHTEERKDLDVSVSPEQLAWLERDLGATELPTFVFMHHSAADQDLRGNRWFEGSPHICLVRQRRELRRLFREQGRVLAVMNGHLHWNHLDVIDGIPYVTVQSLIENLDDDAPGRAARAHAVVRVSKKHVVVEIAGEETARYQFERSR